MDLSQNYNFNANQGEDDSILEPLVVASTSASGTVGSPPRSLVFRVDSIQSSTWSCHILSIIDMVWTALEVFLILLCILPVNEIPWEIAVVFVSPNIIQFAAAILMFKKTQETEDFKKIYRCCQLWLFLAFLTIACNTAFIIWVTITNVITVFLIFLMALKICWRFTVMFFVNEVYNELDSKQLFADNDNGSETETHGYCQNQCSSSLLASSASFDNLRLLENEFYEHDSVNVAPITDDSGTMGNSSSCSSSASASTDSSDILED